MLNVCGILLIVLSFILPLAIFKKMIHEHCFQSKLCVPTCVEQINIAS